MEQKSKNKIFFPNVLLLIIGLIVISVTVFNIIGLGFTKDDTPTVLDSRKNEYYVIGKDPTDIQIETFDKLTEQLKNEKRDYETISDLVAQSFIIDFFNWNNKEASYDIGGLQYMYDPSTFNKIAHFEYYQKVDVFNQVYGMGNLPEVDSVKSNTVRTSDYLLEDDLHETYKTTVKWTYKDNDKFKNNEFIDECELTLINNDGKIVIVEVKMIDSNEVVEDE